MNNFKGRLSILLLMIIDLVCVILSFFSVDYIATYIINRKYAMGFDVVLNLMGTIVLSYIIVFVFFNMNDKFKERGMLEELFYVIKMNVFFMLVMIILLFVGKNIKILTRGGIAVAMVVDVFLMYLCHMVYKLFLKTWFASKKNSQFCYIISTREKAGDIIKKLKADKNFSGHVFGMAIVDEDMKGQKIEGVPIMAGFADMIENVKNEIVDDVFINVPYDSGKSLKPIILEFEKMGITVHLNITMLEGFEGFDKEISVYGPYPVISFTTKKFDDNKMFIKRCIDILGALVGIVITVFFGIIFGPLILIESRGPLIFKQKRVGKNGRYFNIYKFRSMYKDAEERKQALMSQNEMNGYMFKMSDDPRITKVGKFIRKTSIDELPQFFNVLKGDMSLVGTRPPTVGEFNKYACHHKRRLSMKPGITGLWQVSGRSDICDFEEVVKLDLEYIDNWSLILDIKILLKTIVVVFTKKGSR